MTAVYALYRRFYGDQEAAFLASDADTFTYQDLLAHRRKLHIGYTDMMAQVGYLLRLGPHATDTTLTAALGFVERLPQIFGLIAEGKVAVLAARLLLARSAVLTGPQARVFDAALAERLVKPGEVLSIPALREYADTVVIRLDPAAAEARRQRAKDDRMVSVRAADEGMAAVSALLTAQEAQELSVRVDQVAITVCEQDPRTWSQRRADALMALLRGCSSLGCVCPKAECRWRVAQPTTSTATTSAATTSAATTSAAAGGDAAADAAGGGVVARCRTLIHAIANERTLADPGNTEPGYLVGHGPITAEHVRELAGGQDVVIRRVCPRTIRTSSVSAVSPKAGACQMICVSPPHGRITEHGEHGEAAA